MPVDYKPTVHLPKTDFPMRAGLAEREPAMLKTWTEERVSQRLVEQNAGKEKFVLHDGPPYANNDIHQGHALNKTLKDIVAKYQAMNGRLVDVIPGWDCHGLPIELAVDKALGPKKRSMSAVDIRRECRKFAEKWVGVQSESFRRLGVFMRWETPYLTMNAGYEAQTLRELARFVERGSVYRQKKPVYWDWKARTALAEAEIEHKEHTSPSIHVAMEITSDPGRLARALANETVWLVIWTTTPWTLPANLGISVNREFDYVAYRLKSEANPNAGEKVVIVAKALLAKFLAEVAPADLIVRDVAMLNVDGAAVLKDPTKILAYIPGEALEGTTYIHPFYDDRTGIVMLGPHVTLEAGSGLVHTAPGHGEDDYAIGRKHGLSVLAPVDDAGKFTGDARGFEGQFVFDANPGIIKMIYDSGHLLSDPATTISHQYPHSWRTNEPLIMRATDQWFISLAHNDLRKKALDAIDREVTWIPHWGKARIQGMMETRPDWCISRQRTWGVPIAAFYCEGCQHCVCDAGVMRHVANIFEKETADAWVARTATELLPDGFTCPKCSGTAFRKETDILDVWFDSGVSYANVAELMPNQGFPVDLYLEGSDQHRGWFNSSLIASMGTRDRAPYRTVLTHGFVVDGKGEKLSKSKGNGVPLDVMLKKFGADIVRLWVAAEDYREDIRLSDEIMNNFSDGYRKIRNTLRWALGSLDGFDPARDSSKDLGDLDKWALEQTARWVEKMREAYGNYEFHLAYHATIDLCSKTLSAFYFDVSKDRLYTHGLTSGTRLGSQTALWKITDAICRMLAPILSFTADEAYRAIPGHPVDTVFLAGLPTAESLRSALANGEGARLVEKFARIEGVRSSVQKAMEELKLAQQPLFKALKDYDERVKKGETLSDAELADRHGIEAKTVGNSLDAHVTIAAKGDLASFLKSIEGELAELFIVSQVTLADAAPEGARAFEELSVKIAPAHGDKCARCWCYTTARGMNPRHPTLCPKCTAAVVADYPALGEEAAQ